MVRSPAPVPQDQSIKSTDPLSTSLNISGMGLKFQDMEEIFQVIAKKSIEQLNLSNNKLQDDGACIVVHTFFFDQVDILSRFIKSNTTLRFIDCRNNGITVEGVNTLLEGVRGNITLLQLLLSECVVFNGVGLPILNMPVYNACKSIELILKENGAIKQAIESQCDKLAIHDRAFSSLPRPLMVLNKVLKVLDLTQNQLTSLSDEFTEFPVLEELILNNSIHTL